MEQMNKKLLMGFGLSYSIFSFANPTMAQSISTWATLQSFVQRGEAQTLKSLIPTQLPSEFSSGQFAISALHTGRTAIAPPTQISLNESNCRNPTTTVEHNYCARVSYESADKRLNTVWGQLIKNLNAQDRKGFIDKQLAWIKYRDGTCNREVHPGGSGYRGLLNQCLERITKARTVELEGILKTAQLEGKQSSSTAQQYKEQGDSKSRNGDKRGAISDYTSAIRLNSSFAVAYYNRAIDRVSVGDQQGALADFRKAAELFKQQGKGSDQKDALNEIAKLQGGEKTASANCPTGQMPVVVKTSDGQSPSYAGAANAGRNKNGRRTDGSKITPDTRCIFFVDIQSPSNPEETWLISHGWDDSSEGSLKNLAQAVAKRNPQDRVLLLDWSEASNNKGDDGANPRGLSEKLSRGNYYAATWIRPVAEVVVQELKQKYNLDSASAGNSLNLIGHSLGSLISSEVGRIYKQNNGIGGSYLIALDPPSEFNVSTGSPIQDLGGYDLDGRTPAYKNVRKLSTTALAIKLTSPFETRNLVPSNVDRPQRFDSIARFSRAFVGKTSFAGNQAFAATAHESFQMDFGDRSDPGELLPSGSSLGREHGLVVESFTKRIAGEGLAPGFLGLNDRKQHSDIKRDAYPYNRKPFDPSSGDYQYAHEGVINISGSNEFSSFHLESPSVGKVVFSTSQNVENDTVYIQLDATIKGQRGRVAGGDLLPNVYQLFPSVAPLNYMPLVR